MHIASKVIIGVIALQHIYFMYFEMFAWTTVGRKIFGKRYEKSFFEKTKVLAANQGLYNGFLVAGLIWSLAISDPQWSKNVALFFLACVAIAGIYGGITASKKNIFVSSSPSVHWYSTCFIFMIKFSKATPDNASELTGISFVSKMFWGYPANWMALWRKELTITPDYITKHDVIVLQKQREIIGFSAIENHELYWEIAHFWILPVFMNQGLGSQMMDYIQKSYCLKDIKVIADPHAEAFYAKYGFKTIDYFETIISGRSLPIMYKYFH